VLSGVRLKLSGSHLEVAGSDLDLTIRVNVTVSGSEDGVSVLPAKLTTDIVRALEPGAVNVTVEGDEAKIASGRSQFSVRALVADDFPRLPEPDPSEVVVAADKLSKALKQVVRAASNDDARPILTGVLLSAEDTGLRLVATDSYRLAVCDLEGVDLLRSGQKVLVPSRALAELGRLLGGVESVTIHLSDREATFDVGSVRLTTRLIEGEFPNYRQLIPQSYPNRLTVGREALAEAVRRVKLMARESTPIRLALRAESVELIAVAQDIGEAHEEIDARYEGTEMTVAFNAEYLTDGIEATPGDEITLETLDALKPAVLRPIGDNGFLYLLMPVRVS
jgi:DNA polymerase-3 subunit beta